MRLLNMNILFTALKVSAVLTVAYCNDEHSKSLKNSTNSDKDMYVIHATVYEVGILTNKTDNKTHNYNKNGTQESVTFYHTNGTHVDLGDIPRPLLTNVTAQSIVGVAPMPLTASGSWGTNPIPMSSMETTENQHQTTSDDDSTRFIRKLFKRDVNGSTPIKIIRGTALIPPAVGLQSISLPPLLSLNNKLSGIPVPIPNTAVVKYAKVNTLVGTPQNLTDTKVPL